MVGVPGDRWLPAALRGPRLQLLNLAVFYGVVLATVDYGNPVDKVAVSVLVAAALDAAWNRARTGAWITQPFGPVIATLGAWLVLDGHGWWPFLALPVIIVASRHLIRTREGHLLNANNLAMALLILAGSAIIGVNAWGSAPQTLAAMVVFGTIATLRVGRFGLALMYLTTSLVVHVIVAQALGHGTGTGLLPFVSATAWAWALSPLQVMLGFFAVTDPATSPRGDRLEQFVFALAVVLLSVPATVAGRPEAPVFALLIVAPQRHLIHRAVQAIRSRRTTAPVPEGVV